ncbi:MAG TPA: hypothetical protein VM779_12150, partial [Thermoanaerobaculia bacterium]|nr:hypothetical protein [Thermoanaerobaculia bacterium]
MTITAIHVVAAVWLFALLIGIVSWEKSRKGRLRRTDIVVFTVSLIAGGAWMFLLMPRETSAAAAVVAA